MANPRLMRMPRDQRRAQLLKAASEVFAAKGFHAAAMDDIADAAGVSKPVLYQHFPSKLDLYLALLDDKCDQLIEVVESALDSTDDNSDRVAATMDAFWDYVADSDGGFRFIFESDLTGEKEVQKRLTRVNNEIADAIADVIAEDTGLGIERAKLLATALVGVSQVSSRYWLSADTNISLDEAKELISHIAWRGISSFPRTHADAPHPKHHS